MYLEFGMYKYRLEALFSVVKKSHKEHLGDSVS